MKQFSESEFQKKLTEKASNPQPCPFCGETQYRTYSKFTCVPIQGNIGVAEFGKYLPCGIVICGNCGHINLFALGALGFDITPEKQ